MQRTSINDLVAKAKSEIEELSVEEVKGEMSEGTVTLVDIRAVSYTHLTLPTIYSV